MNKLTPEQIKEIKESDNRTTHSELARKFNVTPTTIIYYRSEEFRARLREYQRERYRQMTLKQKKEYQESRKAYQREYHRKRYNNDDNFKKKQLERAISYKKHIQQLKGGVKQ